MGIVQIHLNNLSSRSLSDMVISWYRLFNASSMASSIHVSGSVSSKGLRHSMLENKHQVAGC